MSHWWKRRLAATQPVEAQPPPVGADTQLIDPIEIPPGDPLEAVLLSGAGPVEVSGLDLSSEALDRARAVGVELIVPLIAQGELLGALYLGPRRSGQSYSGDDRGLLARLASRVAPVIKVAQLVGEQQAEGKERERLHQELRVAAVIQQTLLPQQLPSIAGWDIDALYRPAQEVGGDFYDFIHLDRGRLGVVIGDVTDKGIPAALVMATARSILRSAADRRSSPGTVLAEVNERLAPEIPPVMFVTCLYAIIDTAVGDVVFANAGHNLPYVRSNDGVRQLRATGMPLGLMPGMRYEERSCAMDPGDVLVLTSDGITEAHNREGEIYGFARLAREVGAEPADGDVVSRLIEDLESFRGADADQEDDVTVVTVRRLVGANRHSASGSTPSVPRTLAAFELASEEASERVAIAKVSGAVSNLALEPAQLERLKTAVGEVVMNAIEHGNDNRPEVPIHVAVRSSATSVTVRVSDLGGRKEMPRMATPDLEAKLAGLQTPRGWGLFLVTQMVDDLRIERDGQARTIEFTIGREARPDAG